MFPYIPYETINKSNDMMRLLHFKYLAFLVFFSFATILSAQTPPVANFTVVGGDTSGCENLSIRGGKSVGVIKKFFEEVFDSDSSTLLCQAFFFLLQDIVVCLGTDAGLKK